MEIFLYISLDTYLSIRFLVIALVEFFIEMLITIVKILLYSLATTIVSIPFYFLLRWLFDKFYNIKNNWMFSAALTSFVFVFFVSFVVYLFPFLFLGWEFEGVKFAQTFGQKMLVVLKSFWSIIQAAFIYGLVGIVVGMIYSYVYEKLEKLEEKSSFLRIFLSLYILNILIWIVVTIWPWILGGYFLLLF